MQCCRTSDKCHNIFSKYTFLKHMFAQALTRCFTMGVGVCLTLNPSISSDVGSKLPPSAFSTRHPWRSEADGSTSASGTSPLVQSHGLDKNDHPSGVTLSMGFSKGGC